MNGRVRLCGLALAAARAALSVAALAQPDLVARPWVGAQSSGTAATVLGRATGGRDLALGVGALLAGVRGGGHGLLGWTVAGAFCDTVDAGATVASWEDLPARGRFLVLGAAGSGAAMGVLTVLLARRR